MFDDKQASARITALEKKFAHLIEQDPSHWLGIAIGPGWIGIVEALLERIHHELSPFELRRLRLGQIKQKFAELRVYYDLDGSLARLHVDIVGTTQRMHVVSGTDNPLSAKVDELIHAAAAQAAHTCECCGAPGALVNNGGWMMIVCQLHAPEGGKQ